MKPHKAHLPTVHVGMSVIKVICAPASTTAHLEWVCDEDVTP